MMPVDVRMPDGTIIRNVPETATREQIMRAWQSSQSRPEPPSVAERVWKGVKDPVYGLGQIASKGIAAASDFVGSDWGRRNDAALNEFINDDEREYQQKRGGDDGIDWWRAAGNVAATAPLAFAGGGAATLGGRAVQAAKAGAIAGAAQPVDKTNAGEFALTKAKQAGLGAAAGAVAQPVGEVALRAGARALGGMVNTAESLGAKAKSALGIIDDADVAAGRMAREAVADRWATLGADVQKSLQEDVAAALRKHGEVNPDAVRRLADFRASGITPRQSWVTRDPAQWTNEENLAGIANAGEPLMKLRADADRKMLDAVKAQGGTAQGDAYQLGEQATRGVQAAEAGMKNRVDTAYDMFRQSAPDVQGNGARFVDQVSRAFDEAMVGGEARSGILPILNQIAGGKFPVTPSTLYQMQKMAPKTPAGAILRKEIDAELGRMGQELGPQMQVAGDVLRGARNVARQRFEAHEAVPALKAAAEGALSPDDFFKRFVVGADASEVARLWGMVDAPTRGAIRQQMTDYLKRAAVGAAESGDAPFAQATFNRVIAAPGMPQKLAVVIGKRGVEEIQRVGRVAEASKLAPAGNKVNTSNTSQGVANYAMRLLAPMGKYFPVVGPLVANPLKNIAAGSAVARAMPDMSAALAVRRQPFSADPEVVQRLAGLFAMPLAGAAGAAAGR